MSGLAGPIYYLVGASKHREGMRVMKRAMLKADPTGQFRFSDRTAGQNTLLEWEDEPAWLEAATREVYREFSGRVATLDDVENFVIFGTPFDFQKSIIRRLQHEGKITRIEGGGPKGGLLPTSRITFR